MKRLLPIFLILCLLLCACNSTEGKNTTAAPTTETTVPSTTEATAAPTTESQPADPAVVYRNPLNGQVVPEPFTGRAVAFTINNLNAAMPQHGISCADVLYEITVEGGATRCLALFTNLADAGPIGSVRSARTYFVSLSAAYDAVLIHSGRSTYAQTMFNTGRYDHVDADPSIFYRDQSRASAGYAYEHTHFTTGEDALELVHNKFDMTAQQNADYGLTFVDGQVPNGDSAKTVTVNFGNGVCKTTKFTYREDTNNYAAYQHGEDYIDGNTSEVLAFENILVLHAARTGVPGAPGGNVYHELVGENTGYYACGGKIVPIKWSRADDESSFTYTLEDGTALTLIPGKTYIGVIPNGCTVDFE